MNNYNNLFDRFDQGEKSLKQIEKICGETKIEMHFLQH